MGKIKENKEEVGRDQERKVKRKKRKWKRWKEWRNRQLN